MSPTHVDRLRAFYRAAQKAGRLLAVDPSTALVIHLSDETALPRPTIENGIRVFLPKLLASGNRVQQHSKGIELYNKNPISIREILAEPSKYVCTFWESMLRSDFRGKLPKKTLCLYAQWTGYLEEENWKPVLAAFNKAKGRLEIVHTTGHMLEKDILGLVRIVGAKEIVSI